MAQLHKTDIDTCILGHSVEKQDLSAYRIAHLTGPAHHIKILIHGKPLFFPNNNANAKSNAITLPVH